MYVKIDDFIDTYATDQSKRDFLLVMGDLTQSAQDMLLMILEVCVDVQGDEIEIEHLFVAMVRTEKSDAYNTLVDFDIIESKMLPFLKHKESLDNESITSYLYNLNKVEFSEDYMKVLELTDIEVERKEHQVIGTAHMLIALMKSEATIIDEILEHFDVQRKEIIKRAEFYLDDDSTYERESTNKQIPMFQRAKNVQRREERIQSTLQSFGLKRSDKQEDDE